MGCKMAKSFEAAATPVGPQDKRAGAPASGDKPRSAWTKVGPGGRVVLPAPMREALGLAPGDDVLVRLEGHEIRLLPRDEAIRQVQEIVRRYVPEGVSLVDELIAERRAEAAREAADD